jgi:predicted RNA binding protein YcfA (HicA-like mRNA interferase family)
MGVQRIGTKRAADVMSALEVLGGEVLVTSTGKQRGKGSHVAIRMPGVSRPVIVHNAELTRKELYTICRQAQLDWGVFCQELQKV